MRENYQVNVNQEKVERAEAMKALFSRSEHYVFADYRGFSVQQFTALRQRLRAVDARCHVVQNRLVRRVFDASGRGFLSKYMYGPTAATLFSGDPSEVVKALADAAKTSPLSLKGGFVAGSDFSSEQLEVIAKLPGREQLLAQLMATMNGTARSLAGLLHAVVLSLLLGLKAYADKKSKET